MVAPLTAVVIIMVASGGPSALAEPGDAVLHVCKLELTALGRAARFHFVYTYRIATGITGVVDQLDHSTTLGSL